MSEGQTSTTPPTPVSVAPQSPLTIHTPHTPTIAASSSPIPQPNVVGDVCLLPAKEKALDIPKQDWLAIALEKHPQVLEMYERLRPLSGRQSLSMNVQNTGKTEVKETLSSDTMLQLIMEWLESEGLGKSAQLLASESRTLFNKMDVRESRLETLVKVGVMDVKDPISAQLDDDDDDELRFVDHRPNVAVEEGDDDNDEDVYIWDEPESSESNIIFEEDGKNIKAANLNKLVEHLTAAKNYDLSFKEKFLMTYRSFTTPEKLLKKLIERYHVPENELDADTKKQIKLRVCATIKSWLDTSSLDINEKLLATLNDFMDSSLSKDGLAQQLRKKLQAPPPSPDEMLANIGRDAPNPKVPKNIFSPNLSLIDIDDEELARQITLGDSFVMMSIKPVELLNLRWQNPENKHLCANVIKLLHRRDRLCAFVEKTLGNVSAGKQRTKLYERFIRIADYCRQLNNFTTLKHILDALTREATLELIGKEEMSRRSFEILQELKNIFCRNDEGEYATYNELFARCSPPALPCLELILADIQRFENTHNNMVKGNLINFEKRMMMFESIQLVYACRRSPYNLQAVSQIQKAMAKEAKELQGSVFGWPQLKVPDYK